MEGMRSEDPAEVVMGLASSVGEAQGSQNGWVEWSSDGASEQHEHGGAGAAGSVGVVRQLSGVVAEL
jgi:hypothetical protein